jgi:hypothetical protein
MTKLWWKEEGWPWLKSNWWVIFAFPLMIMAAVGMYVLRRQSPEVIDPFGEADQRRIQELETRVTELRLIDEARKEELNRIEEEYEAFQSEFEERLAGEVEQLKNDPDRLRRLMLEVGG